MLLPSPGVFAATDTGDRPRIGLVLSGGGARGAAHIGVIRELERMRVPVDFIAGTSMGAIVGGLYASGMTPDELEKALLDIDWDDIFNDTPDRSELSRRRKFDNEVFQINKRWGIRDGQLAGPRGLIQGRKLDLLLERLTQRVAGISSFDDLAIPYRAVAADIVTGRQVILDHGKLAAAVRASMSIPGAFAPVEIDGRLLVDGGIANNLPVDVARGMGADIVIAVDISTPLLEREDLRSTLTIVSQLTGFLMRQNTDARRASLTEEDVLIIPALGDITVASFKRAGQAVDIGEQAVVDERASLARYALGDSAFRNHLALRDRPSNEVPLVDFVRIDNQSSIDDKVIRARIHIEPGEPLDVAGLEQDMAELYGFDIFETVRYHLVEKAGKTGVVVTLREKPWGPHYLQFGFRLSSSSDAGNELGLVLGYTVTPFNHLGAEWRTLLRLGDEQGIATEWYQPLGVDSPYFVQPQLYYLDEKFNVFEGDRIIAENRAKTFGGRLTLGRELGSWGRLSAGLLRYTGDVSTRVGPPTREGDVDGGTWFAQFSLDTLDDVYFPGEGMRGFLQWEASRTALGADSDFEQLRFEVLGARTWGANTLLGGLRYYTTLDGEAPLTDSFRAGGLFLLPGFADNALTGEHLVVLRSAYQRRIDDLLGFPAYLGGTLQYGNVFENRNDIDFDNGILAGALYLGVNTLLGPVYVGYGRADTGNRAWYISVGNRF